MDSELEAIGQDFYESLQDLTFNSKPHITTLTVIAQENINAARYIAEAVEKRIEKAIPSHKLFTFYLMDSISKNVGSPYTLLFGSKLYQMFTRAYLLVEDVTRQKMIDLFKTWKSAQTSSGLPLFPDEPVQKIEQFLIKASSIYKQQEISRPTSSSRATPNAPIPVAAHDQYSVPALLQVTDRLLYLKNQRILSNPHDENLKSTIQLTNQLKYMIQSQRLGLPDLTEIKRQLDEMTRKEEELLNTTNNMINSPQLVQPTPNLQNILNNVQQHSSLNNSNGSTAQSKENGKSSLSQLNNLLNIKAPKIKSPVNEPPKKDLSSLLSNLQKAGLVKPTNTPSQPSSSTPSLPPTSLLKSLLNKSTPPSNPNQVGPADQLKQALSQYDINSKFINLDPTDNYMKFFIQSKPNKCGSCGKRFANTLEGQKRNRAHLDWHFRINKSFKEGRVVQSRIWYLDDESFVEFRDDEILGNGESGNEDSQANGNNKDKEVKKERKYVVVSSDSEMDCVCQVCKETLKAKYDDELGEWIWDNAIMKSGRVFHQTCFEETTKASAANTTNSSLLSGLLNTGANKRQREETQLDFNMLKNIVKNVKIEDNVKQES